MSCRGVMSWSVDALTADGYDLQFGTHVLGHFYFTELLIPALVAGAKTSPDRHSRVISTSSCMAYLETLDWDTFKDTPARQKMSIMPLYSQSKFVGGLPPFPYSVQYLYTRGNV